MASEINKRDANYVTVMTGVTDDASLDVTQIRVDPTTKRLKVDQSALTAGIDTVNIANASDIEINPATEEKQDTLIAKDFATQTTLALVKAKTDNLDIAQSALNFPAGSGSNSTVTLTNASTAYSVPASASTKNHILVLYNGSDTDMYWGYATLTTGGILLPSGATMSVDLGANQTVFAYCASAGKIINYSYKEIN